LLQLILNTIEIMKSTFSLRIVYMTMISLFVSAAVIYGQKKNEEGFIGKADLYKAKKNALDYLADSKTVMKFGIISDSIWTFAELGMQEFKSSAILIKALEEEGFVIEKGVAGMPTCFVATWGQGKPVIGFLGEFDALPMLSQKALTPVKDPIVPGAPGHGCGHNMMGTAATAAVIAVKRSMELNKIQGTIKFFGSPAEETLISRPYMVRAGVFKDVDAIIDNHASSSFGTGYGVSGTALISVAFTFKGQTAHAGGSPWSGRSALDGVELMDISANYLREHLHPTYRLHYIITEGGEAPNVVPDKASVWYFIRNTDDRLEEMYKRVVDCARGAAIASGTTLDTARIITAIHQKHSNKGMAETIRRNIELVGSPEWTEDEQALAKSFQKALGKEENGYPVEISPWNQPAVTETGGGSTDVGEVSLITPTATLNFPGSIPGTSGHHWTAVAGNYGTGAWKGLNAGAKVMAGTALDLLTDSKLLGSIKNEFSEYSKTHPYKSFLPEGAKPPVDLNKDLMEKYRNALMQGNPGN
jgi:aminobenzoyl-glutamate utilization protein B